MPPGADCREGGGLSSFGVDPDRVALAATRLREASDQVHLGSDQTGRALTAAAQAAGATGLSQAASSAARVWGLALAELATANAALALATELAAAAYDLVEATAHGTFSTGRGVRP